MARNVYEGMFILDANRYGKDSDAVAGQVPMMIEKAGGEILVSRLWEDRRLAYPIKGQRKGTYWLTYFRLDGSQLAELQRQCHLSESILRALFLKVDPRIVDALVAHAQAGGTGAVLGGEGQDPPAEDETPAEAVTVADTEKPDPAEPDPAEVDRPDSDNQEE